MAVAGDGCFHFHVHFCWSALPAAAAGNGWPWLSQTWHREISDFLDLVLPCWCWAEHWALSIRFNLLFVMLKNRASLLAGPEMVGQEGSGQRGQRSCSLFNAATADQEIV